jgi:hypothetical protein
LALKAKSQEWRLSKSGKNDNEKKVSRILLVYKDHACVSKEKALQDMPVDADAAMGNSMISQAYLNLNKLIDIPLRLCLCVFNHDCTIYHQRKIDPHGPCFVHQSDFLFKSKIRMLYDNFLII